MNDTPDVSIIDYGINNLKSISKAFEKLNKSYKIISTSEEVLKAKCLILPGVGAFADGMEGLRSRGLIDAIKQKVSEGTPLLGICLGMQMLFSESAEFGSHKGLDLIEGKIIPFKPVSEVNIKGYKVPHMCWNNINSPDSSNKWTGTLLETTEKNSDVYFIHSYYADIKNKDQIIATTKYGNQEICAAVKKNNVIGTQFHPEKSASIGINILKEFCKQNNI